MQTKQNMGRSRQRILLEINEIMARKNATEMYLTHNEGKSVVADRFIKTLKNKIYKYMTSISKKVCADKLDDIVDKYNNKYHKTIKIKPVDINLSMYIDFNKENNKEGPKFNRISKYKNIFAKGYLLNWSKEIFVNNKIKNTVPWTYVISDPNGEQIVGTFTP